MAKATTIIGSVIAEITEVVSATEFSDIGQLLREAEKDGAFPRECEESLIAFAKKEIVRRAMRRKGEDAYPLFPNISIPDAETGRTKRVYIREKHMRPEQYRQYADSWVAVADHGHIMANETIRRCNDRYGTQLPLPFPEVAAAAK